MKYTFLIPLLFIGFLASLFLITSNSVNGQGFFQSQQSTDNQNEFKDGQQQDNQTGQELKDNNQTYLKYRNKPIGFEIQYPKDWDLSAKSHDYYEFEDTSINTFSVFLT